MTSKKKLVKKIDKLEIKLNDLKEQLALRSFSCKAIANYGVFNNDCTALIQCAPEIQEWYYKSLNGIAFARRPESFPLPETRNRSSCLQYIARMYEVEASDISLILELK